jgi:hypothetical protein
MVHNRGMRKDIMMYMSENEKEVERLKCKETELRKIVDHQKRIMKSDEKDIDYRKLYIYLVNTVDFLLDN